MLFAHLTKRSFAAVFLPVLLCSSFVCAKDKKFHDFGPCLLTPGPALSGEVHIGLSEEVMNSTLQQTGSIFLATLDANGVVQDKVELFLKKQIWPLDVGEITCSASSIIISLPDDEQYFYRWDGKSITLDKYIPSSMDGENVTDDQNLVEPIKSFEVFIWELAAQPPY